MKKIVRLILLLTVFCCSSFEVFAQTYNMPATGTVTAITTCSGTFYDNGGTSNYSNNCNGSQTFCSTTGKIRFTFTTFVTRDANDYLKIYDGPTNASTLIGTYSGTTSPGTVTSSGTCLTFEFVSNGNQVKAGWVATISCLAPNDDCSGATALTSNSACAYTSGSTVGASASTQTPNPTCGNFTSGSSIDVWFSFVGTGTSQTITTQSGGITDGAMAVYSGTCGGSMTLLSCNDDFNGLMPQITGTYSSGTAYYIRFWAYSTSTTGSFGICVTNPTALTCPSGLGTGVTTFTLSAGGYSSGAQTTCSKVNDLTATNITSCGSSSYYGGEDVVYIFNAPATGQSTITLTSSGSYTGIMLYAGCPFSGGICVAQSQSSTGNKSMCVNLVSGTTYYLVIDSWPSPTCNAFSLSITYPSGIPSGTICSNAVNIPSFPYSATTQSTACMGNDYTNSSTGSCGTSYESGEDKVYQYTATASECINVTISNANTNSIGFQVYKGCPGSVGTTCVGNGGGATSGTLSGSVVLPSAGTYYIVVDTWASPDNASYDISVSSFGAGQANDEPCNAVNLTLGSSEVGDNNCTGFTNEPATTPSCWSSGYRNTVWYKVTAPASGSLKIKTFTGTLLNTQIAVYSGTCGTSLTMVSSGCNLNAATCGSNTNYNSEVSLTGLTSGTTYYIAVDGANNLVGTFQIVAIDGSGAFPPVVGMDCPSPIPVCAAQFTVSNPGYSGFGNTCDLPSSYCLASSERNIVWYSIPINASGNLIFDIVPNDFNYLTESETDYDFGIWKIAGTGSVSCTSISSGSATPLRCNYSYLGVTGLNNTIELDAPGSLSSTVCPTCGSYNPDPIYDGAYQSRIVVASGDIYLLAVSNYSNSTSGFSIDFLNSPIGYVGSTATSVTWSGGTDTDPTKPANWGGCNTPSCTIDATVAPFTNQPVIATSQSVKDVTIQAGATLTIQSGVTLTVCGNFTNYGNLTMSAGATLLFNNTANHIISGNLTGSNAIGNITVNQTSGSVSLLNDLDIKGNFTTSSSTSIFNTNGNYIKLAGNFVNANGNTTFTNTSTTGTLEFNGTSAQTYQQGSSQLDLNFVKMNHSSTGVTLLSNMYIKSTTGALNLSVGKIITNGFEVNVQNTATTAVTTGNTTSFVQGNLRRSLLTTGAYDFPVGHSTKGYQRANINFTSATSIGNLLARFDVWGITPIIQNGTECGATYNYNAEDNGWWTITANANASTGIYTTTLYPLNATNTSSALGWTVMKTPSAETGVWDLIGACDTLSTASYVRRTGMSGFSLFGAAQSLSPLPIELLSFRGEKAGNHNRLYWTTASEINNDYFTLEHSSDANNFSVIGLTDAAGNSNATLHYTDLDRTPYLGITYYRLKQTDFDGAFKYSNIISISSTEDTFVVENLKPNPTTGQINFELWAPFSSELQISIIDNLGKEVQKETQTVNKGLNKFSYSLETLKDGVYTFKVLSGKNEFHFVSKIVKY
jgi:CUB domain/Secretion system C-terminal sorting domain